MLPARTRAAKKAKELEVVRKDEIRSDEEEIATPRLPSTKAPKPVQKKKFLRDESVSSEQDQNSEPESDEDSKLKMSKKSGRMPTKTVKTTGGLKKANGVPTKGKKRQQSPKKAADKAKKSKTGTDVEHDDDDYSGDEANENRNRSKKRGDDEPMKLEGLEEDEEIDSPNWTAPNYKDKAWFKENYLKCQQCDKKFETIGEVVACLEVHDKARCAVCFAVITGKRSANDATGKLHEHYQMRHHKGNKVNTIQCLYCDKGVSFMSVSSHFLHCPKALDILNSEEEEENTEGLDNKNIDSPTWTAPNYKDKAWFKENCIKRRVCEDDEKFETIGELFACLKKHDKLFCLVCSTVITGMRGMNDATEKLYEHYRMRHSKEENVDTIQCPHCDTSVSFMSLTSHIIQAHGTEAISISISKLALNAEEGEEEEEEEENVDGEDEENSKGEEGENSEDND